MYICSLGYEQLCLWTAMLTILDQPAPLPELWMLCIMLSHGNKWEWSKAEELTAHQGQREHPYPFRSLPWGWLALNTKPSLSMKLLMSIYVLWEWCKTKPKPAAIWGLNGWNTLKLVISHGNAYCTRLNLTYLGDKYSSPNYSPV